MSSMNYYRLGQAYPRMELRAPYPARAARGLPWEAWTEPTLDARRADSLRFEAQILEIVGAVPGVVVLDAAGRNGPGHGRLRSQAGRLSWQAPGSTVWGPWVTAGDGSYLLEDGADPSKWVRVQVYASYLSAGLAEDRIFLDDLFNNAVGHDDVTAAEAQSGAQETYTIQMQNAASLTIENVRIWLDASTTGLEISTDGSSWSSPTDIDSAVNFGSLAPDQIDTLHLRRTIGAGASSDPKILNLLYCAFDIA